MDNKFWCAFAGGVSSLWSVISLAIGRPGFCVFFAAVAALNVWAYGFLEKADSENGGPDVQD